MCVLCFGAEKGHYLAIVFDENGKMVDHDEHTAHITNCQSGVRNEVPHLGNDEPVRTLGFHLASRVSINRPIIHHGVVCVPD